MTKADEKFSRFFYFSRLFGKKNVVKQNKNLKLERKYEMKKASIESYNGEIV